MEGTEYETTVYETSADADGGTVIVIGGVHGNEVAGYEAAGVISEWEIEAGTLVAIPEADAPAVEAGTRSGSDGDNLNRQFPEGEDPQTELARAIWGVIVDYDPDVVIDLHESTGIYAGSPVDGVGQAIFHSGDDQATQNARQAADYVNQNYVDSSERDFVTSDLGPDTNPTDLIVHKTWLDLDVRSHLIETLSRGVDLERRINWHLQLVGELVEDELFPSGVPEEPTEGPVEEPEEEPEEEEPEESEDPEEEEPEQPEEEPEESEEEEPEESEEEEPEESEEEEPEESEDDDQARRPVADIETIPADENEESPEDGKTVTLDASNSCVVGGEIDSYEWDINDDGHFDHTGETIDVTVCADGAHLVTLRVTSESGRTAVAEVELSTE
ncbi:PKD domain-containing protein [Natronococcus wangiae]|uniref:PKD domain-containing protein n=1 Tax=Natronococcus wangiae TaxID=3068275 RepID=UPI00273DE886|nr:succinylglutamate desuccinylase/aspartoacylase family protein [Natronococcus sp. AD5]